MFIFGVLYGWNIRDSLSSISPEILSIIHAVYVLVAIYSVFYIQIGLNGYIFDFSAVVMLTYTIPMGIYLCYVKLEAGMFLLIYSAFMVSRIIMYFFMT
jgi:hypothetical protein